MPYIVVEVESRNIGMLGALLDNRVQISTEPHLSPVTAGRIIEIGLEYSK